MTTDPSNKIEGDGEPTEVAQALHGDQARAEKYDQPDAMPINTASTLIPDPNGHDPLAGDEGDDEDDK